MTKIVITAIQTKASFHVLLNQQILTPVNQSYTKNLVFFKDLFVN